MDPIGTGLWFARILHDFLFCESGFGQRFCIFFCSNDFLSFLKTEQFRYLGSIIKKDGEIVNDVTHRIRVGWLKWRGASSYHATDRYLQTTNLKGKTS